MTDAEAKRCGSALAKYAEDNAAWWDKIPDYEARTLRKFWQSAWAAATAPRPAPEGTVRVRIHVLADSDGLVIAWLMSDECEKDNRDHLDYLAENYCGDAERRYSIITADIPLPSPPVEVRGEVEA